MIDTGEKNSYRLSYLLLLLPLFYTNAQLLQNKQQFSRQDSLRGSITAARSWWDIQHYDLSVDVDIENQTISGTNVITYTVERPYQIMQIDLQEPMQLTSAIQNGQELKIRHDGNAHFITLPDRAMKGSRQQILLEFEGKPRRARNAPWDGGFSWSKDSKGNPFVATSNQGLGASVWWPCKDHMYDEPDRGMDLKFTVPQPLIAVGNGRLINIEDKGDKATYHWQVVNPINNYGVNVNVGNYVSFRESYKGEKGNLDLEYYVLEENLDKAKEQFKQVPKMLEAFEHWFGPYPFYEDSFKLVEVPYLGMEHQSSVTYGNKYRNGYLGSDLSGTGWGLQFDFIIIHESGHEWFANNITVKDIADLWVHEGFTAYSESLYLDYHYNRDAARDYIVGTRNSIRNDRPLIGNYDVNHEGSGDMYYKGANLLHMIRTLIDDDKKWREILRGLNKKFYHQTVTTQQVESYINDQTEIDLQPIFDQYLRTTQIPELEIRFRESENSYSYVWNNVISGFEMPVDVIINGDKKRIFPTTRTQTLEFEPSRIESSPDFYIKLKKQ